MTRSISRRRFLQGAAALQLAVFVRRDEAAALFVDLAGPDASAGRDQGHLPPAAPDSPNRPTGLVPLGVFVAVDTDESVTITVPRPDMGQGPRTSLAMALAEELEVDWTAVRVRQAPAGSEYGDQTSGGSTSTRVHHRGMLLAGATAREMLVRAAAAAWGVPRESCRATAGAVEHPPTGRRLTYGSLAESAVAIGVPPASEVTLKPPAEHTIVGRPTFRIDNPDVVTGRAVYGFDVRVPGMRVAVVARPPAFGARLEGYQEAAAMAVPGVRQVVPVSGGVAVVADHTWAALAGRQALAATWAPGPNVGLDDDALRERLISAVGALPAAPPGAAVVIDAAYDVPYLAHATMEPMNCVADCRLDSCELWAPTQAPGSVRTAVANALRLPADRVTVNVALSGGGFGRRLQTDYATEAARLSRLVGGPVQVVWTRDDDMRHDYYRQASHHALRGALDAQGQVLLYAHRAVLAVTGGDLLGGGEGGLEAGAPSPEQQQPPYQLPQASVQEATVAVPVPTGAWRSVTNTQYTFANEVFLDELAVAAGRDPVELRRSYLSNARLRTVFELAVERSGWGEALPPGEGRGVACFVGYGSYAAQVVHVRVSPAGQVRVLGVTCAVDVGLPVNPRTIEAQMEGGTVDGLSTALKAGIHLRSGGVVESSFVDYPWLLMHEMPRIDVHIVPSQATPGGLGEVGFPAVSPATINAIHAATGRRVRRLPVRPEDLAGWSPETPTPTDSPTATPTPTATASPPPAERRIWLPDVRREP